MTGVSGPRRFLAPGSGWFALCIGLLVAGLPGSATPGEAGRKEDRDKAGRATEQLLEWGMVAKVYLKNNGEYHISADGRPLGEQGEMYGLNVHGGDMVLVPGDEPDGIAIAFKKKSIIFTFLCCENRRSEPKGARARLHVDLGRKPTIDDLDPVQLKRWFSPFFDIGGPSEEAAVAAVIEALESAAPAAGAPPQAAVDRPTVLSLRIAAQPAVVEREAEVRLVMAYQLAAPGGEAMEITEERTVSHGGVTVPGYPSRDRQIRPPGPVETALPQRIPPGAGTGAYEFRGEVCVAGDCISRTVTFEVVAGPRAGGSNQPPSGG